MRRRRGRPHLGTATGPTARVQAGFRGRLLVVASPEGT
jgi:hypothetical protein